MRLKRIGIVGFALGWAIATSIMEKDWISVIVIAAGFLANMVMP